MPKKAAPRRPVAADIELGHKIRKHRVSRGVTQADLAKELGVSFQQLQKYEKGVNRVTMHRLSLIAKKLECRIDELLTSTSNDFTDVSSLIDNVDDETLQLLRAYSRISDQATQRKIVLLIEAIAALGD